MVKQYLSGVEEHEKRETMENARGESTRQPESCCRENVINAKYYFRVHLALSCFQQRTLLTLIEKEIIATYGAGKVQTKSTVCESSHCPQLPYFNSAGFSLPFPRPIFQGIICPCPDVNV